MPISILDQTDHLSSELPQEPIHVLVGKMRKAGVSNLLLEEENQNSAVFATTDPAVIEVLKALLEEAEADDLSAHYPDPNF